MTMTDSKLTKALHTDITKLKLCSKSDAPVRFLVDKTPFDDADEMNEGAKLHEYIIIGRILPNTDIYKEGAYKIEMKLTPNFPVDPPAVRFLTPIYHPNVGKDGTFCHDLLKRTALWKTDKSLVDVVKAIVDRLENPDIDYSFSLDVGKEYMENRPEFNRKALEFVRKHALPRN